MSKWVQSRYSKDAKKFEVIGVDSGKWKVREMLLVGHMGKEGRAPIFYDLPVNEYIECDPPTQWEVCTREAVITDGTFIR